jgi:hypothetical protein
MLVVLALKGFTVWFLARCVVRRRAAWWWRGERDITVAIALMLAGILLLVPPLSGIVGNVIHDWTGQWNLEAFIAHVLCIGADAAIVHHVAWRILTPAQLRRAFRKHVELPATLAIGLMFAFLQLGNGVRVRARCFYLVPTDLWLTLYWITFCAVLAYIIGYAGRAMRVIRWEDPRAAASMMFYMGGVSLGMAALAERIISLIFPVLNTGVGMAPAAILGCLAVAAFAGGAIQSWRQKQTATQRKPDTELSR